MGTRHITRNTRLRLTLLMVLSLLFQHVALASHVCAQVEMAGASAAMTVHCEGMPVMAEPVHPQAPSTLCVQDCIQQTQAVQDAQLPNLPPAPLLAALTVQLVELSGVALETPSSAAAYNRTVERHASGLAPPLEHRVLLI